MLNESREERIIRCLEMAVEKGIGAFTKEEGEFVEIVEIYPYKKGMFVANTVKDVRKLLFSERKLLVFVNDKYEVSVVGECEIMGPQNVDTCITKEFIDANCSYEIVLEDSKSPIFGKKKREIMQQNTKECIHIAKEALNLLK